MVKNKDSLKQKILKVINYLENKIELDYVILFGSHVTGKIDKYSDIDLAIVSSDFEKKSLEEKASLFSEVKLKCDLDVEIHAFSTTDLEEARPTNFLGYILNNGKFYLKNKKLVA